MFDSSGKVITIGFAVMLFFLMLVTAVGLSSSSSLNQKINNLVHNRNVKTALISEMRNIARERSLSLYRMVILKDPFDIDEEQVKMSALAGNFLKNREQLQTLKMSAQENTLLDETLEQAYKSTKVQRQLLTIIQTGSFEQAQNFLMNSAIPEQNILLEKYDQLLNFQQNISTNEAENADRKHKQTLIFLSLFSFSIIAIGFIVSIFIIRKTTQAEKQLRIANETLESKVLERTHSLYQTNQELQATIETLQDTQEQLVQAEKMASLGSLVAGISHEINTPIGVGLMAVTHLQEKEEEFIEHYQNDTMTREHLDDYLDESQQVCKMIIKNIKRASDLIQNFKQIAVDQSSEEFSTIKLHDYIDDVLLSLRPKLKKTDIEVLNESDPQLSLYTNPGAIYQILSNLIFNSLIHAYDEGQSGRIVIQSSRLNDQLVLSYNDDGKGIAKEHLKSIFDPFYTTRRGAGGSGLGLHIIYNLVNNTLNGSIKVESQEGKGCRFIITLPYTTAQE